MDREEFRQETAIRVFANLVAGYYGGNPSYNGLTVTELARRANFAAGRLTQEVLDKK